MLQRFEEFIRERQYLHNVTPATVEWYRESLRWLPAEEPTQRELTEAVVQMRERGRKATGCNSAIRAWNAYLRWSGSTLKVAKLKEPQNVMATFTEAQVAKIIGWRPKAKVDKRTAVLVLLLLDTGCRISEALGLRVGDLDFANLLVTFDGKGRKRRIVPFSRYLRKALYRHVAETGDRPGAWVFCARTGMPLRRNNVLRDVKAACVELGFAAPARTLHAFRHTFALNYIRRGGSVFHLQKVLGHSSLEMTRRYANLATGDLQAVHEGLSLLSRGPM